MELFGVKIEAQKDPVGLPDAQKMYDAFTGKSVEEQKSGDT